MKPQNRNPFALRPIEIRRYAKKTAATSCVIALTWLLMPGQLPAIVSPWTGFGANDNWSTTQNWLAPGMPGIGDDLVFTGAFRLTPKNDLLGGNFNSIMFAPGVGNFTLEGNSVILGAGGITNNSTNLDAIGFSNSGGNAGLLLGSDQTWNAANGSLWIASGVSNYLPVNNTLTVTGAYNTFVLGNIADGSGGAIGITKNGTGSITLSGTNTYSDPTNINAGMLQVGDGTHGSIKAVSKVTVAAGASLNVDLANNGVFANTVVNNGTVVASSGGTNTLSGPISGTGGFQQAGSGWTILTNTNTYTGDTSIFTGTLQIGNGTTGSISASSFVNIAPVSSLMLDLPNGAIFANLVDNRGGMYLNQSFGKTTTLAGPGVISDTGILAQQGTGTTIITGAETYTGPSVIYAGILRIGNGTTGSINPLSYVTVAAGGGGILEIDLTNTGVFGNNIKNDGMARAMSGNTNTFSGAISGTGDFYQAGSGLTILTNGNSYTGTTAVNAGTLQIGNGAGGSISSSSPVTIAATGMLRLDLADGGVFANNVSNSGKIVMIQTAANTTLASPGVISGPGSLTQQGNGVTTITGAETYTGATNVNAGWLVVGDGTSGSINPASLVTVDAGAQLGINLANNGVFANTIVDNGGVAGGSNNTNTISGPISGLGGFNQLGNGVTILTNSNSYTGPTTAIAGTLQIGNGHTGSISSASLVAINGTGTVSLDLADGSGFANMVHDNNLLKFIQAGTTTQASTSVVSGTGSMLITASGITNILGINTVSGGTIIDTSGSVYAGCFGSDSSTPYGTGRLTIKSGYVDTYNRQLLQIQTGGYAQYGGQIAMHLEGTAIGSYTRYDVTGMGLLTGGTVFAYDATGTYVPYGPWAGNPGGDVQNIIHTTGGLTGQFASNDPESKIWNSAWNQDFHYSHGHTLLYPTVTYDASNAYLTWVQDSFGSLPGLTHNQQSVAKALDYQQAHNGPAADSVVTYLDGQPLANLPAQYDLIAPDELTAIFQIGFLNAEMRNANIERHLEAVRAGAAETATTATTAPAASPDAKGQVPVAPPQPAMHRWTAFAEGVGEFASISGTNNASGYDNTTGGATVGADYLVNSSFAVGILGGYLNTNTDLVRGGDIDAKGGKGAAYATYFRNGYYCNALLGAGYSSYDTHRASLLGYADGSTDGWEFDALLTGGYDFHRGGWNFGPLASLAYTYVDINAFTEHGSLTPLKYPSQSQALLRANLGGRISYDGKIGNIGITPSLAVSWEHDFLDSTQSIDSQLATGNSSLFSADGPEIGRDAARVIGGVNLQVTPMLSIYTYYNGLLGCANKTSNNVSAGVRLQF